MPASTLRSRRLLGTLAVLLGLLAMHGTGALLHNAGAMSAAAAAASDPAALMPPGGGHSGPGLPADGAHHGPSLAGAPACVATLTGSAPLLAVPGPARKQPGEPGLATVPRPALTTADQPPPDLHALGICRT